MRRATLVLTGVVALLMITSVVALPFLGGGLGGVDPRSGGDDPASDETTAENDRQTGAVDGDEPHSSDSQGDVDSQPIGMGTESFELVSMAADPTEAVEPAVTQETEDAVEAGVEEGIELAQSQGVEITQEQRTAALEGATASAAQYQEADVEQIQEATKGAVHGSLMQEQAVEAEQIQVAVGGATGGALSQHQTVTASQMQSATWGATHGAVAQHQRVTVEQIQFATYGAAAGAAAEAGEKDVDRAPKIQEAAQGSAYGVLEQYQKITVEQRQQVTVEHVQHAAAGAASGSLAGSTAQALEADQRIGIEQRQEVTVKQIQKAATGAAKGALVQRQEVTVEQTQAAAYGAGAGPLKKVQTTAIEQVQRVSITQIQEASFGSAKGAIVQSQEATIEQIQVAADGGAQGVLVQKQEISVTQVQAAATGAAKGAVDTAVQQQIVEIEQIQAAAFGAGEGAVLQKQVVDVVQIQALAEGASSGTLLQYQEATIEQIQIAAASACVETAKAVQYQQISITQLQVLTQETASDATAYAIQEGIDDEAQIVQHVEIEVVQKIETIDELEGEASLSVTDQESVGETVTIDSVSLSEGGFVAIYDGVDLGVEPDAVLGQTEYLEAGDHEDIEIDLEEPLAEDGPLLAAAHHDTTGDETFQYVESGGEDDEPYVTPGGAPVVDGAFVTIDDPDEPPEEPEASLSVSNQVGDGETLTIDEANATVAYVITAEYDGEATESELYEANETVTNESLDLEPPIEENTTVEVGLEDENGTELTGETIEYTLEEETDPPEEPEATLSVSDQVGNGSSLIVDEANATTEYVLRVTKENEVDGTTAGDADEDPLAESDPFAANETVTNESLDLEPPLEEDTSLNVSVVSAASDADTVLDTNAGEPETTDGEVLESETIEYTVEPDEVPMEFDVEFLTCTQAEVTGTFQDGDQIIAATTFYESEGIGNTMGEYAITVGDDVEEPFEGTIFYEVDETDGEFSVTETDDGANVTVPGGDFGAAITGFASPESTPGSIDHYHPRESECVDEVRPEPPTLTIEETIPSDGDGDGDTFGTDMAFDAELTDDDPDGSIDGDHPVALASDSNPFAVEATTQTDDGIEVTFGYENHNDADLIVDSDLEGTTETEPPSTLEPGTDTFTVDWTPETEEERLTWVVGMERYDYDEPFEIETDTAGEIDPSEPAEFTVDILEPIEPVEQGEDLTIEADIENVGDEEATQPIDLELDGVIADPVETTLGGEESETIEFTVDTTDIEPGEYDVTVSSEDDTDTAMVSILEVPEADDNGLEDDGIDDDGIEDDGLEDDLFEDDGTEDNGIDDNGPDNGLEDDSGPFDEEEPNGEPGPDGANGAETTGEPDENGDEPAGPETTGPDENEDDTGTAETEDTNGGDINNGDGDESGDLLESVRIVQ